jgi:putative transposase
VICQAKYLNNLIEQDHRFIKKISKPILGLKGFISATATLAGIELYHMLRKGPTALRQQLKPCQQSYAPCNLII